MRRRIAHTAFLIAVLGAGLSLAAISSQGTGARPGPLVRQGAIGSAADRRIASLPLQAQLLISSAVGRGQPQFAPHRTREGVTLAGGGIRATLTGDGITFATAAGTASMRLAAIGRSKLDTLPEVQAGVSGTSAVYLRPSLREWYQAGPLGIEQGFLLGRRPAGRGSLELALALPGRSAPELEAGQLDLTAGGRTLFRYGGLAARDASGRTLPASMTLSGRTVFLRIDDREARYPVTIDPFMQQGTKIVANCTSSCSGPNGQGELGESFFGATVALSAEGGTALIGANADNNNRGAAWVFTRTGTTWSQQGDKLVAYCGGVCSGPAGTGESGDGSFGESVALSSDGNTALIGASGDNGAKGAAWVFTRAGSTWSQQGTKLVADCSASCSGPNGTGENGNGLLGFSVALSADGNTALLGAPNNDSDNGAAWIYLRSGATWTAESTRFVGDCQVCPLGDGGGFGESGSGRFGWSVALSGAGTTALIGAPADGSEVGAAWVFQHGNFGWTPLQKIVGNCTSSCSNEKGTGESGAGRLGWAVALTDDGNTALLGAPYDAGQAGAAWVFTASGGQYVQQGSKLTATGESGGGRVGESVALDPSGITLLLGGGGDSSNAGAVWEFDTTAGGFAQAGSKIVATGESGAGSFGYSVALGGDSALVGALNDGSNSGAAFVFTEAVSVLPIPTGPLTKSTTTQTTSTASTTTTVVTSTVVTTTSGPKAHRVALPKPKGVPRKLPRWALALFSWQHHGHHGKRPHTPKPLPKWYAAWAAWKLHPYKIVG